MNNKDNNTPAGKEQLSAKLEFTARITLPDGTVIEKVIEADGGIPSAEEMDFHTLDGFRRSFDKYERAAIDARNRVCKELTDDYVKELSKKRQGKRAEPYP